MLNLRIILAIVYCIIPIYLNNRPPVVSNQYPDPLRFEKGIRAFEQADSLIIPQQGAIICTESSIIRMWYDSIQNDQTTTSLYSPGSRGQ